MSPEILRSALAYPAKCFASVKVYSAALLFSLSGFIDCDNEFACPSYSTCCKIGGNFTAATSGAEREIFVWPIEV